MEFLYEGPTWRTLSHPLHETPVVHVDFCPMVQHDAEHDVEPTGEPVNLSTGALIVPPTCDIRVSLVDCTTKISFLNRHFN